jgi:DNA-binding CsgD family transcriptional regulator
MIPRWPHRPRGALLAQHIDSATAAVDLRRLASAPDPPSAHRIRWVSNSRTDASGAAPSEDGGADILARLAQDEEWDELVSVLDTRWSSLIAVDPGAVRDAIASLPPSVLADNPRWAIALDYVTRMVGGVTTTRYRGATPPGPPTGLLDGLAHLTARAAAARADGRLADAEKAARQARKLLDDSTVEARERLAQALPELQFQWGMVWEYVGDADRAIREYVDSFDGALLAGNVMTQTMAAGALAWMHALAGRNTHARSWLERLPHHGGQWWTGRSAIPALFAEALLLIDEFRFPEAREVLARVDLTGAPERWPFEKVLAALTTSDAAEAISILSEIETLSVGLPEGLLRAGWIGAVVAIARSVLLTTTGHLAQARRALVRPASDRQTFAGQILLCMRAGSEARVGNYAAAARLVSPLHEASLSSPRSSIAVFALRAAHELHAGTEAVAAELFAMSAALATENRSYYPLAFLPEADLARLLALRPGAVPPAVVAGIPAIAGQGLADPFARLSAKEREVLAVILAGKSVAQAAEALFVSTNTVKTQLRSIYRKTGVNSRRALDELAVRFGHHPG